MKTQSIREFIEQYGDINLLEGNEYNGSLYLEGCTSLTSLTLPEGVAIGGSLYLPNGEEKYIGADMEGKLPKLDTFIWKYHNREYIKADGIFQRIVKRKGNVFQVQNIGAKDITYLVTDGNDTWSHGSTLHEAHTALQAKMLQCKSIEERIADFKAEFESGKKYPASEFFKWHHILTGSCEFGRREFCRQHNIDLDNDTYTVEEFIELTKNAYGGEVIRQIQ